MRLRYTIRLANARQSREKELRRESWENIAHMEEVRLSNFKGQKVRLQKSICALEASDVGSFAIRNEITRMQKELGLIEARIEQIIQERLYRQQLLELRAGKPLVRWSSAIA